MTKVKQVRHRRSYTHEQRENAVGAVLEHLPAFGSVYKACAGLSPELGVGKESLRRWTLEAIENRGTPASVVNGEPPFGVVADIHYTDEPEAAVATPAPAPARRTTADDAHISDLKRQISSLQQLNEALKVVAREFAREYTAV